MISINTIKQHLLKVPKPITQFALKAVVLFVLWQTIYSLFLLPNRIIDKPLSQFTGEATATILKWINKDTVFVKNIIQQETIEGVTLSYEKATLFTGNKRLIGIGDGCNGLSLYMLFIGFIIAYPGSLRSKLLFGIIGLLLIITINILRVTGLVILVEKYPSFAPFAHHYFYKIITYALVFFLWVKFTKAQQKNSIANA